MYTKSRGTLLVSFLALAAVVSVAAGDPSDDEPELGTPQKNGDWEVTPIGKCQHTRFNRFFGEQHRLLVAVDDLTPQLWDTEKGKRVAVLRGNKGIDDCAVSPDGKQIVTTDRLEGWRFRDDGEKIVRCVRIWDLATGKLDKKIDVDLSEKGVRDSTDWNVDWWDKRTVFLKLNCRGNQLRASLQTVLALVDPETGKVKKMSDSLAIGESLLVSPDRKRALAGLRYGVWRDGDGWIAWGGIGTTYTVDVVDLENLKVVAKLDEEGPDPKEERSIVGKVWSPDCRHVATVGSDHVVHVWDAVKGKLVARLKGHTDWILAICFSPDGRTVLTASEDCTARLWDTASGKQLHVLSGHTAGLNQAVFDAKGERVLTGGEDETARIWDASTGKELRVWPNHDSAVRKVAFVGGKEIRTGTVRGMSYRWSAESAMRLEEKKPENLRNDRYETLFVKDDGQLVEVWAGPPGAPGERRPDPSPPEPQPRLKLKGPRRLIAAAVASDGKRVATADGIVRLWEPVRWNKATGEGRRDLTFRSAEVDCLALAPNGETLAVGCRDGAVKVLEAAEGTKCATFETPCKNPNVIVFSPDGKLLAAGGGGDILWLGDVSKGKVHSRIDCSMKQITSVAFTPDCKTVVTGGLVKVWKSSDGNEAYRPGEVKLWDVATGKEKKIWKSFDREVTCLACSPDGKILAAGSRDNLVRLWDVQAGEEIDVLKGQQEEARCIAFSRDSKTMAVGCYSTAQTVELWDIAGRKKLGGLRAHPRRTFVLTFLADGKTLASVGDDETIKFWDIAELRKLNPKK
jgi:WD40 repeat protein